MHSERRIRRRELRLLVDVSELILLLGIAVGGVGCADRCEKSEELLSRCEDDLVVTCIDGYWSPRSIECGTSGAVCDPYPGTGSVLPQLNCAFPERACENVGMVCMEEDGFIAQCMEVGAAPRLYHTCGGRGCVPQTASEARCKRPGEH